MCLISSCANTHTHTHTEETCREASVIQQSSLIGRFMYNFNLLRLAHLHFLSWIFVVLFALKAVNVALLPLSISEGNTDGGRRTFRRLFLGCEEERPSGRPARTVRLAAGTTGLSRDHLPPSPGVFLCPTSHSS